MAEVFALPAGKNRLECMYLKSGWGWQEVSGQKSWKYSVGTCKFGSILSERTFGQKSGRSK